MLKTSSPNSTWEFQLKGQCLNDKNKSDECVFIFSLCHPLPFEFGCGSDSSVCQVSSGQNATDLGKYHINPFQPLNDGNGFLAIFEKPDQILNPITNLPCQLKFIFEFDCNENVPWIHKGLINFTPAPIDYSPILGENCDVSFIWLKFFF